MINIGLKLWTNNVAYFEQAVSLFKEGKINFIELYYNDVLPVNYDSLRQLKNIPINIHATDNAGFEKFLIQKQELEIWDKIKELADFFKSNHIIVHPGREHTQETFKINLNKIDDSRILIENMPGLDINNKPMYATTISELESIKKVKNICFDFEKAVKAAFYRGIDYKKYITDSLQCLKPQYFHLSGGNCNSSTDEHLNLWEGSIDCVWIKQELLKLTKDNNIFLVFEVPKNGVDLENDVKNMYYFESLKV